MSAPPEIAPKVSTLCPEGEFAARHLAHAENLLQMLTAGQLDAVIDPHGKTYLLLPAQERLRESEELFAKAFSLSPDCMVIERAADRSVVKANEAMCHFWSIIPEEVVGKSTGEFYGWLNAEERIGFAATLEEKNECLNCEATLQMRSGQLVQFNISSRMITLNGESCVLSVMCDITEKGRAQKALKESESRYRRLFETAKDGILILDAETGMVVDVNPFLIRTLGFSREQLLEKAVWELGFFRDVVANAEKFAELREKEYVRYENLPLQTSDGQRIEVEFISNVYLVDDRKVIQCNVRDVTARKKAEEAARLRENALDEVSQGVLICDEKRLITYANAGFTKITGYEESELLGRSCAILQGPNSAPETIGKIREALNEQKPFEGEILNYRKDGQAFWNELTIAPIHGEQGRPLRFIGIQRDVTERKQAEVALKESQLRYQSLFENMVEGYAYCRLLFEGGQARDFIYLEVNSAFETLTGLKNVTGKKVSEVIPGIQEADPEILQLYNKVALTGKAERRETYVSSLKMWLSISVYSLGGEDFVAVFDNITERKLAEETLRQSEISIRRERALLRALIDSIPDLIFFKDKDSVFLGCNKALENHLGIPEEKLIGLTDYDVVPKELAQSYRSQDHELFSSCQTRYTEDWIPSKNGEGGFFETVKTPYFGPEGEALGLVAISRNITERKQAQAARDRLGAILESTTDMVGMSNPDGRLFYLNRAGRDLLEVGSHEDLTTIFISDLHQNQGSNSMGSEGISTAIREGAWSGESVLLSRQGKEIPVSQVILAHKSPEGEVEFISTIVRDITERKQAERALKLALERMQLAVKAGRAGTWDFDLLTGEVDWDGQMLALYGKTAENVEPGEERWNCSIHPDDLPGCQAAYTKSVLGGKDSFDIEFRIHRADNGNLRFIRGSGIILHNEAGQPVRITGINWDVTEERVREEKLAAALAMEKVLSEKAQAGDRAKSEFLAVMSHEIRTPMNGILGFSDLLEKTPDLPDDCREYVNTITSSGEALLRIIDDILDFSRLEAGGLKIEKSLFSPREILKDIHALLTPRADDKHLEFQFSVADGVPDHLWNDAGRLRQVLLNLAGNAIKFTAHGSIVLGAQLASGPLKAETQAVDFFVRDTGPGIPKKDRVHLFEPFTQADSSISRRFGGTGLGLSISRNLVKLMGGKLTLRSKVGLGSEFCVTLPIGIPEGTVLPGPGSADDPLDATFAQHHAMQILLVEDDFVNLKLMLMMLRRLGYEALIARDGIEAMEIYISKHPDCILMDLQMPRKDGLQATKEIRGIESATPGAGHIYIAALTANTVAEDRQKCFEAGMDGYVNKPIKHTLLAKTLEQACEMKDAALRSVSEASITQIPFEKT